ncbi:MAG: hypothetical protein AAGA87_01055 [Pseudomonadota bacterium]
MQNWIKSLRQDHLDLNFRAAGGLDVEIVERPGLWMPDERLQTLTEALRQVASTTLDAGSLTYGVFSGDPTRLENTIVTLIRRRDGHPVAFNALALMDVDHGGTPERVLHLGLVMVDPGERSKGIAWILYGLTCILLLLRAGFRPLYVSNVTQVPAVVGMVAETFSEVHPTPDATDLTDFRKLLLAREIMANHRHVFGVGDDATFDEAAFVIENAYTGGSDDLKKTFEDAPKHRDATYNDFCRERLDYDRGDDILQIGKIDLATIRSYLMRSVPKGSIAQVTALGAFILIQRAVLPVFHWFDTTKPSGPLRPA